MANVLDVAAREFRHPIVLGIRVGTKLIIQVTDMDEAR